MQKPCAAGWPSSRLPDSQCRLLVVRMFFHFAGLLSSVMKILNSLLGMVLLLFLAWLLSENRKAINWRTVGGALLIQVAFAGFVLAVPFGKDALFGVSEAVQGVMNYANDGINFLFGNLANPAEVGFIFAIKVLPMIIFFSALISVFYHLGIMQKVVQVLGGGLQKFLGTSRTESISATGNIFVGQTEAPLLIKPYIPTMTDSELFAVMVGGLASVAGAVLAGYASLGVNVGYLVAASFMAAPGGLLMAKMILPETETPQESSGAIDKGDHANLLDAAATGASSGMHLAMNVGAMLLAFIALIALLNGVFGWAGNLFGIEDLSLQEILVYVHRLPPELSVQINNPASTALIKLDKVPASTAFTPSRAISGRRCGASAPSPPSKMAIEERLAKPHSAKDITAWV